MKRVGMVVFKNTAANIVRGGAAAIVVMILPYYLTRTLTHDHFAAWVLLLQIAAYGTYLDFGLQTTLSRFIAQSLARGEAIGCNEVISSGLILLAIGGLVSFGLVLCVDGAIVHLFPSLPAGLIPDFRAAIAILGGATALSLPLSVYGAIVVGMHRNEYLALSVGLSKITGGVGVVIAARYTQSIVAMAACMAFASLLGGWSTAYFARRLQPTLRISVAAVRRRMVAQVARFSCGLMAWSCGGLLVSGLDLTVLGHASFGCVGYYSVATSVMAIVGGVSGAVSSALLTPLSALHAAEDMARIHSITMRVGRVMTYANMIIIVATLLFGSALVRVWVGPAYAAPATVIIEILMVANTIRLIPSSYAAMLIATGQQRHGVAQGLVEGLTNLAMSLSLAPHYGAIGVACGTLIGAVAGVLWTWTFTMENATLVPFERNVFIMEAALEPAFWASPLYVFLLLTYVVHSRGMLVAGCVLTAALSAHLARRCRQLGPMLASSNGH